MTLSNTHNIEAYKEIVEIRTMLKAVQQLSWHISSLEKRYPLESVSENELPAILDIFRGFRDKFLQLSQDAMSQKFISEKSEDQY